MIKKKVDVIIPKFKITSSFDLEDYLKKMGMEDAFTGAADFSGMTGKKDLQIDKVVHKAFIEVNEKGTEAAASTAVTMRKSSAAMLPVFRADHPFLYFVKDNKTGSILFMGQVMNPK